MTKYKNDSLLLRALYQCKELEEASDKPLEAYLAFIFKPIL